VSISAAREALGGHKPQRHRDTNLYRERKREREREKKRRTGEGKGETDGGRMGGQGRQRSQLLLRKTDWVVLMGSYRDTFGVDVCVKGVWGKASRLEDQAPSFFAIKVTSYCSYGVSHGIRLLGGHFWFVVHKVTSMFPRTALAQELSRHDALLSSQVTSVILGVTFEPREERPASAHLAFEEDVTITVDAAHLPPSPKPPAPPPDTGMMMMMMMM
jgi:hypothetical protein